MKQIHSVKLNFVTHCYPFKYIQPCKHRRDLGIFNKDKDEQHIQAKVLCNRHSALLHSFIHILPPTDAFSSTGCVRSC
jgi:hypothetical protein